MKKAALHTAMRLRATVVLTSILLAAHVPGGHAQQQPRDSAAQLLRQADSVYQLGTSEHIARARDLWAQAVHLYQVAGDRRRESETLILFGRTLLDLSELDSALTVFHRALRNAAALGSRPLEAEAKYLVGKTLHFLGRADSVLIYHRSPLRIRQELGDSAGQFYSLGDIGGAFWAQGQLDSALAYSGLSFRFARGTPQAEIAGAYTFHGLIHHQSGRLDSARVHYHEALRIARSIADRRVEGGVLNNLAGTFADVGEVDSSLYYFRAALSIREELGDRRGSATTLDNIGMGLATVGLADSALAYHRRALRIAREIGDRRTEGYVLPSVANAFAAMGQLDSAIAYNLAAVSIMRANGDRLYEASALSNTGIFHLRRGDTATAIRYQDSALALARELRNGRFEARALDEIGSIMRLGGRVDSALVLHRSALVPARRIGDRILESRILANIARAYRRNEPNALSRAVAYFDSAGAVRSLVVRRAGSDLNRVSLLERYNGLFAEWTLTWLNRSSELGAAATAAGLAASERGRSQGLLNLMRRAASPAQGPHDLISEGERLISRLRASRTAALIYQATSDTLLIWAIGSDGTSELVRSAIGYDSLATLVGEARSAVGTGPMLARGATLEPAMEAPGRLRRSWAEAADVLAAFILPRRVQARIGGARDLVIVPQGALAMIPFAALPIGSAGAPLGAETAIRYAPSLTALAAAESRPAAADRDYRGALVVGNPTMPFVTAAGAGDRTPLLELPGAEAEARATALAVGATPLTGAAASEAEIWRRIRTSRLVHLATHGFAYHGEARARESFVALAPDSSHDGRLTVGELLDDTGPDFLADLVVLSACQTGLGDLKLAEGTIGLQRAFLARGARAVLVSLWSVSDEATRVLMDSFYRHWLTDSDRPEKAEALRRAQSDIRSTPGFQHPRFWAAFQMVGAQ